MRTFGETPTNDFYLLPNGNLAILTEGEAFAQCCKTRMQAIVGEMKYEADEGMPYFATAWNAYNPAQFEAAARTVILGVAGAIAVTSFTVTRDGEVFRYAATIQSIYGKFQSMADYQYVTKTGLIVPDAGDVLADVQGEYRAAFGQDLVVTSDTNQGVMIAGETTARTEVAANNSVVANQINPLIAGGVFLDAICALSGLERAPATFGVIPGVTVTGRQQTIIPQGSQARDESGVLWATVNNVQIGSTGSATVDFMCSVTGPVNVATGDLSHVVDNVLGWEGVNNTLPAIPGTDEQSDESLRLLRLKTLAKQGISTREAQISDLYLVPGVRSLSYRENIADTTQVIDGISMVPHSVWACVYGGADVDVAMSLLINKTDGANWNGAVSVATRDRWSGQAYTVKFDRPTVKPILVRVTIATGSSVADPETAIPADIVAYASGQVDGEAGFTVGTNVSPFELAGAINRADPGIFVKKVELAFASGTPTYVTTELTIAINEVATVTEGSVQVIVA